MGHVPTTSRVLLFLLLHVGRQFVASHHAKESTFGGVGLDHIALQPSRAPSGCVLEEAIKELYCSSAASRYALLTKILPTFLEPKR